jgi:YVTN family beta-propeller protein
MTARTRLSWPGQRRSAIRVALLFLITAGAYWPIWVTRAYGWLRVRAAGATRIAPAAVAVLLLLPFVNVLFAVVLALDLARAMRRAGAMHDVRPAIESEPFALLLLAAPFAAIGIAVALGLSPLLVGYLVWPLELPAALALQRALNRMPHVPTASAPRGAKPFNGEVVASLVIALAIVTVSAAALAAGGGDGDNQAPTRPRVQYSDIAAGPTALWVTRIDNSTLQRLDPRTGRPIGAPIRIRRTPLDVTTGYGATWVADYQGDAVSRIDPRSGREIAHIPVGRGPFGIAVGLGSVWVTDFVDRRIVEIDPQRNRVVRKIPIGQGPRGIDVGAGSVWAASGDARKVYRYDPASGRTTPILVGRFGQDVAVGGGRVWLAAPQENQVLQIDPRTNRVTGKPIQVGLGPASIDYGAGSVWVANGDGTVSRIDPHTAGTVGEAIRVGAPLTDLTARGKVVWVLRGTGQVKRIEP